MLARCYTVVLERHDPQHVYGDDTGVFGELVDDVCAFLEHVLSGRETCACTNIINPDTAYSPNMYLPGNYSYDGPYGGGDFQ